MKGAFEELKVEADENRFEQELIFYMEKLDISEEICRLKNHLQYFKETLTTERQAAKESDLKEKENSLGERTKEIGKQEINIEARKSAVRTEESRIRQKDKDLNREREDIKRREKIAKKDVNEAERVKEKFEKKNSEIQSKEKELKDLEADLKERKRIINQKERKSKKTFERAEKIDEEIKEKEKKFEEERAEIEQKLKEKIEEYDRKLADIEEIKNTADAVKFDKSEEGKDAKIVVQEAIRQAKKLSEDKAKEFDELQEKYCKGTFAGFATPLIEIDTSFEELKEQMEQIKEHAEGSGYLEILQSFLDKIEDYFLEAEKSKKVLGFSSTYRNIIFGLATCKNYELLLEILNNWGGEQEEDNEESEEDYEKTAVAKAMKTSKSIQQEIYEKNQGLDLVLVGDLTGSMASYHQLLKDKFKDLCKELFPMIKNLKIGIVFYLDHDSHLPYVTKVCKLTKDVEALQYFIESVPVATVGNSTFDEAVEDAFNDVVNMNWREIGNRSVVLFGDAKPHEPENCPNRYDYFHLTKRMFNDKIVVNSVFCGGRYGDEQLQKLEDVDVADFSESVSRLGHPNFFSWVANVTGGMIIGVEQIDDLIDIIMAAAAKDAGNLEEFEKKLKLKAPSKLKLIDIAKKSQRRIAHQKRKLLK
uniref:Microtubule-associated protein 1A n=1 Tax=Stylophora pistillata TaxID=50429 RepID=A0A2B4R9K5_STYPI